MSEKSSYWYDSSPILGSTHQIVWQGGTFTCNGEVLVCNGTRLTTMQNTILEKICKLLSDTNVCDVVLPTCFSTFFGTVGCADSDNTVIDFINLLLDTACQQQTQINELPTTNNPFVTLSYCCCNDETGCNTQVTLTLSEHIQKIVNCLCDLKTEVTTLQSSFTELNNQINGAGGLVSQLAAVKTNTDNWILNKIAIQAATDFPIILT